MVTELIPIAFNKIMQSKAYTAIVLGNDQKKFAIYVEPRVGKTLQLFFTDEKPVRPLTHELCNNIFENLSIRVLQVVIHDFQDTVFYARLFIEQLSGELRQILEIDARPSDCITLALMQNAPVLCNKEVFEKAIAFVE
jgi:bifunctional DNase/RNase